MLEYRADEARIEEFPGDLSRALDTGLVISLDRAGRSFDDEFGAAVSFIRGPVPPSPAVNLGRVVAAVEIIVPAGDEDSIGEYERWIDGVRALCALGHVALDYVRTQRKRHHLGSSTEAALSPVVCAVQLDVVRIRRVRKMQATGQVWLQAPGGPSSALDLTSEEVDSLAALPPMLQEPSSVATSAEGGQVMLVDAMDVGVEVFAQLVRRPEVEAFAGEQHDPDRLVREVVDPPPGRYLYVALYGRRPMGFLTLTGGDGGEIDMCFMIALADLRNHQLAGPMFELGLRQAQIHGYRVVRGRSEPPCVMKSTIAKAGGTITAEPDGLLHWAVVLESLGRS